MPNPISIGDYYLKWAVFGLWPCGHSARIDLGRFMAWGMADVPMLALCKQLRCPDCDGDGPADIGTRWRGKDVEHDAQRDAAERKEKVRVLEPRAPMRRPNQRRP
jgi:hypothetical protein